MAMVTVTGPVLWTKHIHGDARLRDRLNGLPPGDDVELLVGGVRGFWRKMSTGRDGRLTPGLSPRGKMQGVWRELNATQRGEDVPLADPPPTEPPFNAVVAKTLEERMEAFRQFARITGRSEPGWKFSRQEIYDDRDDELAARRDRAAHREQP